MQHACFIIYFFFVNIYIRYADGRIYITLIALALGKHKRTPRRRKKTREQNDLSIKQNRE